MDLLNDSNIYFALGMKKVGPPKLNTYTLK